MGEFQQHASMYQACRAEMVEAFNAKLKDLNSLKETMAKASQSLLEGLNSGEEPLEEAQQPELTLQDMYQKANAVEIIASDEELVPAETEGMEDQTMEGDKKGNQRRTGFRKSPSPTKVANQTLKKKGATVS